VPEKYIYGKAVFRYWPMNKMGSLDWCGGTGHCHSRRPRSGVPTTAGRWARHL